MGQSSICLPFFFCRRTDCSFAHPLAGVRLSIAGHSGETPQAVFLDWDNVYFTHLDDGHDGHLSSTAVRPSIYLAPSRPPAPISEESKKALTLLAPQALLFL